MEFHVTQKRSESTALRVLKKALRKLDKVQAIVTDRLRPHPAARRELV